MSDTETPIGWTHHERFPGGGYTWNLPSMGCTPVTEGCYNCYAMTGHNRKAQAVDQETGTWLKNGKPAPLTYQRPFEDVRLMPDLMTPRQWNAKLTWPKRLREPSMVFVNSTTDWLHSAIPDDLVRLVLAQMGKYPEHIFMLLTKRTARLARLGPTLDWPRNVWAGVSIEGDPLVNRANHLRIGAANAAIRFISGEPLLRDMPSLDLTDIDWLIVGAESGRGARPMDIAWARRLRDMAKANTATRSGQPTAFFLKQMATPKGHKIVAPELDGQRWLEYPPLPADGPQGVEPVGAGPDPEENAA